MKWKVLESTPIFSSGLFNLRSDRCQLSDGRVMPRYFVMDFPDWVNVVPVTKQGQVILVKQYRHASAEFHLELPGGSLDPRLKESIQAGARREMLEETGYDSNDIVQVASHYPNPALQSNQMHTFIAYDCKEVGAQNLDEFEELTLHFCSIAELESYLVTGKINHSIMMASIARALPILKQKIATL